MLGTGKLCVAADLVACACLFPVLACAFQALAVGGVAVGVVTCAGTDDEAEIAPVDHGGGGNPPAGGGGTGGGGGLSPGAPPPPLPPPIPPAGNGGGGGDRPPRRNPARNARRVADLADDDDEEDDDADSDFLPLSEDCASAELSAEDSAVGAGPRLPGAAQPNYFSRSGERAALARRIPIWGFSLPQTRPDEYGDRFPRPFRVHNDSLWAESFAAASASSRTPAQCTTPARGSRPSTTAYWRRKWTACVASCRRTSC